MLAEYVIPEANLPELEERVGKINKRAIKKGLEPIKMRHELSFCELEYRKRHDKAVKMWSKDPLDEKWWDRTGRMRRWLTLFVDGETPKYDGWELIGVLSPIVTEDGVVNVTRAVPGKDIPIAFRSRVGECDHCQARRRRTETFVLFNEFEQRYVCVGRQCIADFLGGVDPHALAARAQALLDLARHCADAGREEGFGGSSGPEIWDLLHVLRVSAAVIRKEGWLSKTKARDLEGLYGDVGSRRRIPTAEYVWTYLRPTPKVYRQRSEQQWLDEVEELFSAPDLVEVAEKAMEWARELPEEELEKDYLYNLHILAKAGYVESKTMGLAVSMVASYKRAADLEIEKAKKAERSKSKHVGEVGKRIEVVLTCEAIYESEGFYGVTGIHRLRDEEGNVLVWFASGKTDWLVRGKTYRVKATVASHDEYKDTPQTKVQRVKIIEEV